jgi:hypothetical protein
MSTPSCRFQVFQFLFFAFCFLFLSSCRAAPTTAPRASSITCNTAYRSSSGVPIEREENVIFGDMDAIESVNFADLTFNAQYSGGEMNNERALRLWVTEAGGNVELLSQLYQLAQDSGPQNQFVGGHGFTGLNYAYHPTTGAELQFWCTGD